MNPQTGLFAFRIAIFILLVSTGLLFVVQPGSAEFYITLLTLIIGLFFMALVVFAARRSQNKHDKDKGGDFTGPI